MQMRLSTYRLLACMAVEFLAGLPRVAAADELDSCVKYQMTSRSQGARAPSTRTNTRVEALCDCMRVAAARTRHGVTSTTPCWISTAMGIDPTYPSAYNNRCIAWVPQRRLRPGHRGL